MLERAAGPARAGAPARLAAAEPAAAPARGPLRGGGVARRAGPVRAHPERVLRGAARGSERAQPAQPGLLGRARLGAPAQRAGVGARAQPRGRAARRRAARAAARRPRPVRLRGRRQRRLRAPAGARCWRPTASTTSSSSTPLRDAGERALFFGHFGYEANRRGVERFLDEGWPERAARAPRGAAGDRRRRDGRRAARAAGRRRGRRGARASSPTCPGALAAARAVIVPIWEGGGTRLKVLEALAAGRAVVATSLGASGVGFRDGRHGLLGELPAELAAALVTLLADPQRAASDGRGGPGAGRELPLARGARRRVGVVLAGRRASARRHLTIATRSRGRSMA